MRSTYQTKQKGQLLNVLQREKKEFTIHDIYEKLNGTIGLTTIYRFIDKLVEEGSVQKILGKGNTTYYQYLEECLEDNHFYLKCSCCGKVIHVDCDCVKDLSYHIQKEHQFQLEENHILISGLCKKCMKEEKC